MHVIGETKGIKLHSPKDAYFSYFNSPYFGHSHAAAIDIYPHHGEWGGPVASPTTGKLIRVQKTSMGRKKEFPTDDFDFGIAIQPEDNEGSIVRMLHCKPTLKEGTPIERGDVIGTTIRSRYFNYWTGPHYHVEVMPLDSFSRSTRSFPLELQYHFEPTATKHLKQETEFIVGSVTKDCIIGFPRDLSHTVMDQFCGLSAIGDGSKNVGIIDGGLSHYKHGGVIGQENGIEDSIIRLQGHPVGQIQRSLKGASFFLRGYSVSSFLDGKPIRGLSCFLYPKQYTKNGISPLVLVPRKYNEFSGEISEGDVCILKLESTNNTVIAD